MACLRRALYQVSFIRCSVLVVQPSSGWLIFQGHIVNSEHLKRSKTDTILALHWTFFLRQQRRRIDVCWICLCGFSLNAFVWNDGFYSVSCLWTPLCQHHKTDFNLSSAITSGRRSKMKRHIKTETGLTLTFTRDCTSTWVQNVFIFATFGYCSTHKCTTTSSSSSSCSLQVVLN